MIIGHPIYKKKCGASETNGLRISRVDKTKYLEGINCEKLNWNAQFYSTRSKISTCLRSLKRPKYILPDVQLCCVLYGLVEIHLRNGDNVWVP